MGVVTITKENFEAEVVGAKVPVVIDFWASGVALVRCSHRLWMQLQNQWEIR